MTRKTNGRPALATRRTLLASSVALLAASWSGLVVAAEPIKIGLITALSGQSALAGEAISRGLQVAIDEINAKGGLLGGRKLELVRRDDEANPAKGVVAARELIFPREGGGASSVAWTRRSPWPSCRWSIRRRCPSWAPGRRARGITQNGANPNFAFRVSAVDEIVDVGMLAYAQKTFKTAKPGLMLINNPWGESNEKGLKAAMAAKGVTPAGIEKFEANDVDMVPQLTRLKAAGADTLFLVGNVGPSAQVVKSLDRMGWKVPIVSHWGPAGGRFTELAGAERQGRALRADLQLLRQAGAGGRARDQGDDGQVPRRQGPGRHHARPWAWPMPTTACTWPRSPSRPPARPTATRCARASTRSTVRRADQDLREALHAEGQHDAVSGRGLRLGAVHRQPHPAGRPDGQLNLA